MAAITLFDVMSQMDEGPEKAVLMVYLLTSPILQHISFMTRREGVMAWKILAENPYTTASAAYRKFNEEFTTTKVKKEAFSSNVSIAGGRFSMDELLQYMSPDEAEIEYYAQLSARALRITKDILEGSDGDGIIGIKQIIDTVPLFRSQIIHAGAIGTPTDLSLKTMNKALALHNAVPGSTYIYMSHNPYMKFMETATGNVSTGYNIRYALDQFGQKPKDWDGYPIVVLKDGAGDDIISNKTGGGSDATSVYFVTYGEDAYSGFQVRNPTVKVTQDNSVLQSTSVEWALGAAPRNIRCITRIDEVKATYA